MAGAFGLDRHFSRRDRTIYVSTDADGSGTGDLQKPFNTLAEAVDNIPTTVTHNYAIRIIGHFSEPLIIEGRNILKNLQIRGHSGNNQANSLRFIRMVNVQGRTNINNLSTATEFGDNGFYFEGCAGYHRIDGCRSVADLPPPPVTYWYTGGSIDQGRGVMALYGSSVAVYNTVLANRRYGVRVSYNGMCETRDTSGHNAIGNGIRFNGMISTHGTQCTGEHGNNSVKYGGIITDADGAVIVGNDGVRW